MSAYEISSRGRDSFLSFGNNTARNRCNRATTGANDVLVVLLVELVACLAVSEFDSLKDAHPLQMLECAEDRRRVGRNTALSKGLIYLVEGPPVPLAIGKKRGYGISDVARTRHKKIIHVLQLTCKTSAYAVGRLMLCQKRSVLWYSSSPHISKRFYRPPGVPKLISKSKYLILLDWMSFDTVCPVLTYKGAVNYAPVSEKVPSRHFVNRGNTLPSLGSSSKEYSTLRVCTHPDACHSRSVARAVRSSLLRKETLWRRAGIVVLPMFFPR